MAQKRFMIRARVIAGVSAKDEKAAEKWFKEKIAHLNKLLPSSEVIDISDCWKIEVSPF